MLRNACCKTLSRTLLLSALVLMTGCMKKMTVAEFENMCKPPPRPEQYKQLDYLVGSWEMSGDMNMTYVDGPVKMSGKSTVSWDTDNWVLTEHGECTMGSCKMKSLSTWYWNSDAKKFDTVWYDSMGMGGSGRGWYDEAQKTYHMKASGKTPMGTMTWIMTMKVIDNNTMEGTMTEMMGWSKTGEGKFMNKRVK